MFKKLLLNVADTFGFRKSSKYVQSYLHRANMRSGIYMAAIIVIIEIWMVIRQTIERVIPQLNTAAASNTAVNPLQVFYSETSNFWLFLFMGISLSLYCICYVRNTFNKNWLITICASALIGLLLFAFIDYPTTFAYLTMEDAPLKNVVYATLLLIFFIAVGLFQLSIAFATIYKYKGGNKEWITSVLIITLFALACLIFGMMVSYSDFFGYAKDPVTGKTLTTIVYDEFGNGTKVKVIAYKQIICFLMMTIYVGCLLIWKPYISIGILGCIFLGFHLILVNLPGLDRPVQDGDLVNYITFFISLAMVSVSIFSQRQIEAKKDEELERLATIDELTGLYTFQYFITLVDEKIKNGAKERDWMYLFMNISSFKVYNDQRGYLAGNKFLRNVGEIIKEVFPNSIISRQSDDKFVAFVPTANLDANLELLRAKVKDLDKDIKPNVLTGACMFDNPSEDAHATIEKARYAYSELKARGNLDYLQYDKDMHDKYIQIQYIVAKVDEAVEKGWIVAYYQPVVFSKDQKLCGVEALARWIDPKYGFMNPGIFIGALEDAKLAYKVDLAMLEIVCRNMRKVLDAGEQIVPTSINFSRADFSKIDVPNEIVKITSKYNIPTEYLHIEITESALLDDQVDLVDAMRRIRENGFAIWLDDFGSGYSSFNTLKDYEFDVLKLDMAFLKGFDKNEKAKPLIQAVINMAGQVGMRTLSEGVETKEQAEFLKKIGCERLQGYLFSKPIPYEELNKGIAEKRFVIADDLH